MKEYFEYPKKCPVCGFETEIEGKYLICPNDSCKALAIGNLERWIESLNIMDIGESIIEALYKSDRVREPADFYKLKTEHISTLERLGERSANKIISHLKEKMEIALPEFIAGLNIHNFSTSKAENLMEAGFDTIEKMQEATVSDLLKVKGIQQKTAEYITRGLSLKAFVIKNLIDVGITIKNVVKVQAKGNKFNGLSFCFTGAINRVDSVGKRFTREIMHQLVLENGGKVMDSVSKELSYLVMADPNSSSSKAQKARKISINILSEADFFKMLNM